MAPSASTLGASSASSIGAPSVSTLGPAAPLTIHHLVLENYSWVDIISAERALGTLMDMLYQHRDHRGQDHALNVDFLPSTLGRFEWSRVLMGRPWGVQLFHEQATYLHLVWHEGAPALRVTTALPPHARFIMFRRNQALLSSWVPRCLHPVLQRPGRCFGIDAVGGEWCGRSASRTAQHGTARVHVEAPRFINMHAYGFVFGAASAPCLAISP